MQITQVRISLTNNKEPLLAFCSIVIDELLKVESIRIVNGNSGVLVCMPSMKKTDGSFKDIVYPINHIARKQIELAILNAYMGQLKSNQIEPKYNAATRTDPSTTK